MAYPYYSLRKRGTVIAILEFISSLFIVILRCTQLTDLTASFKEKPNNYEEIPRWAINTYALDGTIAAIGILELISVMTLLCSIVEPSPRMMGVWLISKIITTGVSIIVEGITLVIFPCTLQYKFYVALEAFRDFYSIWIVSSLKEEVQLSSSSNIRPITTTPDPIDINKQNSRLVS